jgi:hydroxymethylglutaryl-CoA lyase
MAASVKIIECPRDAMQGMERFIPTERKIDYINALLRVGFHTIDFGSFVSPKAIPQMADTAQVLRGLETGNTSTGLLAIVANIRGAEDASAHSAIRFLGFPLSISETFQKRNTNKSIAMAMEELRAIKEICVKANQKLVVYISMGFGNPYGDPYETATVVDYVGRLGEMGADVISLADTVGVATETEVETLFNAVSQTFTDLEIGVHLHSRPDTAHAKIAAAWRGGCRRFDGALH